MRSITLHTFSTQIHAVLPSIAGTISSVAQGLYDVWRLTVVAEASTAEWDERAAPAGVVYGDRLFMQPSLSRQRSVRLDLRLRPVKLNAMTTAMKYVCDYGYPDLTQHVPPSSRDTVGFGSC